MSSCLVCKSIMIKICNVYCKFVWSLVIVKPDVTLMEEHTVE